MGRPEHSPAERAELSTSRTRAPMSQLMRWSPTCPSITGDGSFVVRGVLAQYASCEDHRFFCVECFNAPAGQRWVAVIWPQDHEEIELVLWWRPKQNRNWTTGEPVDKLREENRTHALEILGG